jgi:mannosyltransferase OCH1-like enzyme
MHAQIPHLGDYTFSPIDDDAQELRSIMQTWVLQENDFGGKVKLSSQSHHSFYRYSLWRANSGEHLFDGAAGDLAEAMDAMRAHIHYLSAERGSAARE